MVILGNQASHNMKRIKSLRKQTCHCHVLNRIKLDFQVPAMSARDTDLIGKFFKSTLKKKERKNMSHSFKHAFTFLETHSSPWLV